MNISKWEEVSKDEPAYRAKQAWHAVFCDLVSDWNEVRALPLPLRERLQKECPLGIDAEMIGSEKGDSVKTLVRMDDGALIETVLMRHNDGRNTVCVSSQVGCPMRCAFCATGKMGLTRNLTADEIVMQVLFFARLLKPKGERVSGVVFMGMGEPFLNYENVMDAIYILHDPEGLNIGMRHLSISTCGIVEGIKRFTKEDIEANLAISLHAPNDALRQKLMPVAGTHTLTELFEAVDAYIATANRKVMFEYTLMDGVNDSEECARELASLMRKKLYMVNLIAYNATGEFRASSQEGIARFKEVLERNGVRATIRHRFGRDIKGACGQLATERERGFGLIMLLLGVAGMAIIAFIVMQVWFGKDMTEVLPENGPSSGNITEERESPFRVLEGTEDLKNSLMERDKDMMRDLEEIEREQ